MPFVADAPVEEKKSGFVPDSSPVVPTTPDWKSLYGGLDKVDQTADIQQQAAFDQLSKVTDSDKESRAAAVNQSYVRSQLPSLAPAMIQGNWPAVRSHYAKLAGFTGGEEISDTQLYNFVRRRISDQQKEGIDQSTATKQTIGQMRLAMQDPRLHQFWENVNRPVVPLPSAPEGLPDVPVAGQVVSPALMGAAWNTFFKPVIEGIESPLGIATAGIAPALGAAGKPFLWPGAPPLASADYSPPLWDLTSSSRHRKAGKCSMTPRPPRSRSTRRLDRL